MNLTHALAAVTLALHLYAGDRIVEHSDTVDRIQWVLPAARLEAFRRGGVVINEEFRTQSRADETVLAAFGDHALIRGTISLTTFDVPRGKTATDGRTQTVAITPRNAMLGDPAYDISDAATVALPAMAVVAGSRWTTRLRVITPLGSGVATFEHRVGAIENGLVRVDVVGQGAITGKEYNLPKLLPGSIALQGSAWYSLSQGIVVRESYRIENVLVKPAGKDRIGFREVIFVDADAHKAGRLFAPANVVPGL